MLAILLWISLLSGCGTPVTSGSSINAAAPGAIISRNKLQKEKAPLFDNRQPFEIISAKKTFNKYTTDTAVSRCSGWNVSNSAIEKIIKNAEPIDGTTWDFSFLVLACTQSVTIVQKGQPFNIELNAGSFFTVNNGDSTVLYGDYKKSDRKYFLEAPDDRQ